MIGAFAVWLGVVSFVSGGMVQYDSEQMKEQHMAIAHANCVYFQNDAACTEYGDLLNKQDEQEKFDSQIEELKRVSTLNWR